MPSNGCWCVAEAAASGRWAHGRRSTYRRHRTRRWSLDFVSDTLTDGRRFRVLCVVDDFIRECLPCSPIRLCPAGALCANWTRSPPDAATRRAWSVTTARHGTDQQRSAGLVAGPKYGWHDIASGKP